VTALPFTPCSNSLQHGHTTNVSPHGV
jgi:hypothetical protein